LPYTRRYGGNFILASKHQRRSPGFFRSLRIAIHDVKKEAACFLSGDADGAVVQAHLRTINRHAFLRR